MNKNLLNNNLNQVTLFASHFIVHVLLPVVCC